MIISFKLLYTLLDCLVQNKELIIAFTILTLNKLIYQIIS
jgi:hypothetical protein